MRRYGEWSGNLRGTPEDPTLCVAEVYGAGSYIPHQCQRKRGKGKDGLLCGIHARVQEQGKSWLQIPEDKD